MRYAKSDPMMTCRKTFAVLAFAALCGCGGGGSSVASTPTAPWERFRRLFDNSAQGGGTLSATQAHIKWSTQIDPTPIPIIASPAISLDGTIYIGSGDIGGSTGSLAAFHADGTHKWTSNLTSCERCAGPLGPLVSSPAVYTINPNTATAETRIFVGSITGKVLGFDDPIGGTPTCAFCFMPQSTGTGDDSTIVSAEFLSSPNFKINPALLTVDAVIIGARLVIQRGTTTTTIGKLYSLNGDGSLKWQFPRPGAPDIGPISSSPAIGNGGTLYFATDDGELYALSSDGTFKWSTSVGALAASPFTVSPLTNGNTIYIGTENGRILALNIDGSPRWLVTAPPQAGEPAPMFIGSLAFSNEELLTPTPTATPVHTPLGPTPTPPAAGGAATITPTPTLTPIPFLSNQLIVGVTKAGQVVIVGATFGSLFSVPEPLVSGAVIGSPAVSDDGYVVFGTSAGTLYALNTTTGNPPPTPTGTPAAPWPLDLCPTPNPGSCGIRSSPAIDANGTIYVGTENGFLYAVGNPQ